MVPYIEIHHSKCCNDAKKVLCKLMYVLYLHAILKNHLGMCEMLRQHYRNSVKSIWGSGTQSLP